MTKETAALAVIARNEAIQRPVYHWIASFLAMTVTACNDGRRNDGYHSQ
ncbi:MAG: hypothetical protein LBT42_04290 [Tannerella sp.]|nr:hypothetical protein [Tannerella sp.]